MLCPACRSSLRSIFAVGESDSLHFLSRSNVSVLLLTEQLIILFLLIMYCICFPILSTFQSAQPDGSPCYYVPANLPAQILIEKDNRLHQVLVLPAQQLQQQPAESVLNLLFLRGHQFLCAILLLQSSISVHSLWFLQAVHATVVAHVPACPYHYNISVSSCRFR